MSLELCAGFYSECTSAELNFLLKFNIRHCLMLFHSLSSFLKVLWRGRFFLSLSCVAPVAKYDNSKKSNKSNNNRKTKEHFSPIHDDVVIIIDFLKIKLNDQ